MFCSISRRYSCKKGQSRDYVWEERGHKILVSDQIDVAFVLAGPFLSVYTSRAGVVTKEFFVVVCRLVSDQARCEWEPQSFSWKDRFRVGFCHGECLKNIHQSVNLIL